MSISIKELNKRATEMYAKKTPYATPEAQPSIADAVLFRVAKESGLTALEYTFNPTFTATVYVDKNGKLINCCRHTTDARYTIDGFEGVGFNDDISWVDGEKG
jgi:hypothetical protein